jgi:hypothetical protein
VLIWVPHSVQKRAPGAMGEPQFGHRSSDASWVVPALGVAVEAGWSAVSWAGTGVGADGPESLLDGTSHEGSVGRDQMASLGVVEGLAGRGEGWGATGLR